MGAYSSSVVMAVFYQERLTLERFDWVTLAVRSRVVCMCHLGGGYSRLRPDHLCGESETDVGGRTCLIHLLSLRSRIAGLLQAGSPRHENVYEEDQQRRELCHPDVVCATVISCLLALSSLAFFSLTRGPFPRLSNTKILDNNNKQREPD